MYLHLHNEHVLQLESTGIYTQREKIFGHSVFKIGGILVINKVQFPVGVHVLDKTTI